MFSCKAIEVLGKITRHGAHSSLQNCGNNLQLTAGFNSPGEKEDSAKE